MRMFIKNIKEEINKEILIQKYITEGKSPIKIAKEFKRAKGTIYKLLTEYEIPRRTKTHTNDLIGKKIEKLQIISEFYKNGRINYNCICDCGKECTALRENLIYKNRKPKHSCGCERKGKKGTGYKDIPGSFWCHLQNAAKRRDIPFEITIEYVWELYEKQNRKCALTNMSIGWQKYSKWNASIDRIDSKKGYTNDNIQIIHKTLNRMKNIYSQDYFIHICHMVSKQHEDKYENSV